jgi:hypothetical protein
LVGVFDKSQKTTLDDKKERCANTLLAFNPYPSVVPVDKFFAEEKSQSGAGLTFGSFTVCFNVDPEQRIDKFLIHPNAIVFD